jgi:hypothetical protein
MEIPNPAVTVTESRQRQSALISAQQQQEESQMSFYPVISGNIRKSLHTYVRIITVFYLSIKILHFV